MDWGGLQEALVDAQAQPERGYPLAAGEWPRREVAARYVQTVEEARHDPMARDVVLTNQGAPWGRAPDRYSYQLFELTEDGQYVHIHDGTVPCYTAPAPAGYVLYRSERGAALALLHNPATGHLHILVYNTGGIRVRNEVFGKPEDMRATQCEVSAYTLHHGPDARQRGLCVLVYQLYAQP